jgi:hypothetical protein
MVAVGIKAWVRGEAATWSGEIGIGGLREEVGLVIRYTKGHLFDKVLVIRLGGRDM